MRENEQIKLQTAGQGNNTEIEVDLVELCLRLLEKWKLIAVGALIGTLIMLFYSFVIAKPVYEATSKLYVLSSSDSAINLSDLQIGSYLTSDYTEVFKTWEVHEIVRQNLGLGYTREQLDDMLTVSNPGDTRVLYITVENGDPNEAALLANEYASVAKQYISATMLTDEPSQFSEALVPEKPVSPRKALNVIIGFVLGALAVGIFLIVRFMLDDKIKTADDIRRYTGLPTLAVIPDNDEAFKAAQRTAENRSADRRSKA